LSDWLCDPTKPIEPRNDAFIESDNRPPATDHSLRRINEGLYQPDMLDRTGDSGGRFTQVNDVLVEGDQLVLEGFPARS